MPIRRSAFPEGLRLARCTNKPNSSIADFGLPIADCTNKPNSAATLPIGRSAFPGDLATVQTKPISPGCARRPSPRPEALTLPPATGQLCETNPIRQKQKRAISTLQRKRYGESSTHRTPAEQSQFFDCRFWIADCGLCKQTQFRCHPADRGIGVPRGLGDPYKQSQFPDGIGWDEAGGARGDGPSSLVPGASPLTEDVGRDAQPTKSRGAIVRNKANSPRRSGRDKCFAEKGL